MRAKLQVDGEWKRGVQLLRRLVATSISDVAATLAQAEAAAAAGHWVVGWVCYDAAPAFDRALVARRSRGLPLAAFGVYRELAPASAPWVHDFSVGSWRPGIRRERYLERVADVRRYIASGDTYQVNLTLPLRASFEGDPAGLFAQLVNAQPVEFAAYLEWDNFCVCCASPELFFERVTAPDGTTQLSTRPMKGTAARDPDPFGDPERARALAASEKDRAENVMITDMLRNDLGRIAIPGSVQVPALCEVETYPTVHQMTSTVTASVSVRGQSLPDIFRALFPCASITGAPKVRTMHIIRELEAKPRGLYCGALGLIRPGGDCSFSVVIRTAVVDRERGRVDYGVGGGIVWDSVAEQEWEECRIKTAVLRAPPVAFELLETMYWSPADGVRNWPRHRARLERSAGYFHYELDLPAIEQALSDLNHSEACRLRLTSARSGAFELEVHPLPQPSTKAWQVPLDSVPVDPNDVFLYHKTTRRTVYDEARARHPDAPDVILQNTRGELTETSIGNLVLVLDGVSYTPPIACGLLAGVRREELLASGELQERVLTPTDLERAEAVYMINDLRGSVAVTIEETDDT